MKIAGWNVNSLNVRLPQVLDWLSTHQPDCLCLQETKLEDDKFPEQEIRTAGYLPYFTGQKTYNGVAILSRAPLSQVTVDLPGDDGEQRRYIAGTLNGIRIINVYVPNGQEVDSDKYAYKLNWLKALNAQLKNTLENHDKVVLLGDFNITPDDRDVYDPEALKGKVLCSEPEREAFNALLALGLTDSFRLHNDEAGHYSWWDYRQAMFRRKLGLRIDLILLSQPLAEQCTTSTIDATTRALPRPSDHAPVIVQLAD